MKVDLKTAAFPILGLLMTASTGANASEDWTWEFTTGNCESTVEGTCSKGSLSRYRTYGGEKIPSGDDASSVTVSGWANTYTNNTTLELGYITHYDGGLGVKNQDGFRCNSSGQCQDPGEQNPPEHAVDNDQRYDLVLFHFAEDVSLHEISLGYRDTDADISVLAWQGTGAPDIEGIEYTRTSQGLEGAGWQFVGNYDVDNIDNSKPYEATINAGGYSSDYWIVGAYNTVFEHYGCVPAHKCQEPDYPDYFKILALTGKGPHEPEPTPGIPSPGTLLLLASGALLINRNKNKILAS